MVSSEVYNMYFVLLQVTSTALDILFLTHYTHWAEIVNDLKRRESVGLCSHHTKSNFR